MYYATVVFGLLSIFLFYLIYDDVENIKRTYFWKDFFDEHHSEEKVDPELTTILTIVYSSHTIYILLYIVLMIIYDEFKWQKNKNKKKILSKRHNGGYCNYYVLLGKFVAESEYTSIDDNKTTKVFPITIKLPEWEKMNFHNCNSDQIRLSFSVFLTFSFIFFSLHTKFLTLLIVVPIAYFWISCLILEKLTRKYWYYIFLLLVLIAADLCGLETISKLFQWDVKDGIISRWDIPEISCSGFLMMRMSGFIFQRISLYSYYLPNLFNGPYVDYQRWYNSNFLTNETKESNMMNKVIKLMKYFLFFGIILFVTYQLALYIYPISLVEFVSNVEEIYPGFHNSTIPTFDRIGFRYYGFFYYLGTIEYGLKYLYLYGIGLLISAVVDGIEIPILPFGITFLPLPKGMWKYFDVGIYEYLVRTLYIPLRNTNFLLAGFICYSFVYIWHGRTINLLYWSICCYISYLMQISIEKYQTNQIVKKCLLFIPYLVNVLSIYLFYFNRNVMIILFAKFRLSYEELHWICIFMFLHFISTTYIIDRLTCYSRKSLGKQR
ncbi:hypothetical protein SNEBB_009181 [Seison nebaliae]|nr:hypothetical protein SNEBB_009181 [Seison nebaliae]